MSGGKRLKANPCRRIGPALGGARGEYDAQGLLDTLKDARVDLRLMPFWRAVNDPNIVAHLAQILPHLLKAWTVEKPCHRDEANDACLASRPLLVYFPRRPAPEVNVEIP
jgi:hypothetical protein